VNDTGGRRRTLSSDGGEEFYQYDEVDREGGENYVEHHPDPFADDATEPYHEAYLPEYEPDPHLYPGYAGDNGPQWGYEEDSARQLGPPCENCGGHTRAESFGWAPETGETVDWAVYDDCGLGWGPAEGWVELDE